MSSIILTGIKTKLQWKIRYFKNDPMSSPGNLWSAWPVDEQVKESGAPVVRANTIEEVIEKIELVEQGVAYESDIDK